MILQIREELASTPTTQSSVVDITSWVNRAALDIIGIAVLGIDFTALQDPDSKLTDAFAAMAEPSTTSTIIFMLSIMISPWVVKLFPGGKAREIRHGAQYVKAHVKDIIRQRESETEEQKEARKDLLSVAWSKGSFTTDHRVDQARTFLGAGHETTATSVQLALYILTRPENLPVQQRLREEIFRQQKLSSAESLADGEIMSVQTVNQLPYLDAVSKECLRFYAPSPFSKRIAVRDTIIQGVHIRKGTPLLIPNWAVNRSRDLWGEDATEFRPERWLNDSERPTGGADALAFQSFSFGVRGCIGKGKGMRQRVPIRLELAIVTDTDTQASPSPN